MTLKADQNGAAMALNLDARAGNVLLVRQAVEGAVRALGAEGQIVDDIKLAVTEACSNVVKYAYGGESGPLAVEVAARNGLIEVIVRDAGTWDGADKSDQGPSGMGIPIMESVTVERSVERRDEGTVVTLLFDKGTGSENGDD